MRAVRAAARTRKVDDSTAYGTTVAYSPALHRGRGVEPIPVPSAVRAVKVARASKRHPRDLSAAKRSQGEALRSSHKHADVRPIFRGDIASRFPMPYPGMECQGRAPRAKSPGRVRAHSANKKAAASSQKKRRVAVRPTTRQEFEPRSKVISTMSGKIKQTRKRPRSAHVGLSREITRRRPMVSTVGSGVTGNQRGHKPSSPKPRVGEGAARTQHSGREDCQRKQATR